MALPLSCVARWRASRCRPGPAARPAVPGYGFHTIRYGTAAGPRIQDGMVRNVASRREWLDTGLEVVAELGARALTIDQLTTRMGLTKGSFYHHFGGTAGYVTALMAHFEAEHTSRYIQLVEQEVAGARGRLRRLIELAVVQDEGPALETAIRSWALEDPEVDAAQSRVDATRIAYLRGLCREISDDDEADDLGLMLYLLVVGAECVRPPVPLARVARLYDRVLPIDPTDDGPAEPRSPAS